MEGDVRNWTYNNLSPSPFQGATLFQLWNRSGRGCARSRSLCQDLFTLVSAFSPRHREVGSTSCVVRARKQILCRLLQRLICKGMVILRRPRIEDQEVNSFDRIVFDLDKVDIPQRKSCHFGYSHHSGGGYGVDPYRTGSDGPESNDRLFCRYGFQLSNTRRMLHR
jgi:hypothetical protein